MNDIYLKCRYLDHNNFDEFKNLAKKCFENNLNYPDYQYAMFIDSDSHYSLGIFNENNNLVGFICARLVNQNDPFDSVSNSLTLIKNDYNQIEIFSRSAYISLIGIDKEYQRMGIAKYLLNEIKIYFRREFQIDAIYLHVETNNKNAIGLYEKMGYSKIAFLEKYYYIGDSNKNLTGSDDAYFCVYYFEDKN